MGKNLLWVELHLLDLDSQTGGNSSHIEVNLSVPVIGSTSVGCFYPKIASFSHPSAESNFNEKEAIKQLQQQQREAPIISERSKPEVANIPQSPLAEIEDRKSVV